MVLGEEKAERIDEKNVVEGIAVYKLQPIPEYVKIGNQTINTTDVLSAESALKESKLEEETKWTKEEQELLALAGQIRAINQPRMHATVKLPDTITPAFSGASNELLANLKAKGIDYVYSYVWVDGAEKAQGEIVIPDHYRLKRVFATKGDKNNPEVIDVPEYQKGAKRPYYIRDVGKTITIYVDGFSGGGGEGEGSSVATIDPNQDYDCIHTLSFNTDTGTCKIRLYRGSTSAFSGTVYYRAGTSGEWTELSVSGTTTTFPISSTTMQVAHDWNKEGNNYMTASFYGETKLIGIALSQKAALSGAMGANFMVYYARDCTSLTSLAVPDTSGLTSAGYNFMYYYAYGCSALTSLAVPDTSGLTSVGSNFMYYYARDCSNLTSLPVPDTSSLENTGTNFMYNYAYGCNSLTELVLPKVGWFATHDVSWDVPSNRLGYLQGVVLDYADLAGWRALTASGKTLYINYIQDADDVIYYDPHMAVINPEQEYDIIHTLTFAQASGTCPIRLYRGSASAYSGTVYYRAGTSGNWTSLSVSGTTTTFPITATTMQVGYNWNKSGNNYMTASFYGETKLTGIAISQKAVLSGAMGNYFMYNYARDCSSLTSLAVPDTSGLTSVGNYFMYNYARDCSSLTSLAVPDTSGLTRVGTDFMSNYASNCANLTSLAVPDTSGLTSVDDYFLAYYARNCANLTSLAVPDTSGLTSVGNYFMYYYAYNCANLTSLAVPDTSGLTSVGNNFMYYYAYGCNSLTELVLPKVGWFATHDVNWHVPSSRLGILKGYTLKYADLAGWKALTASGRTLYINYIQDPDDVICDSETPAGFTAQTFRIVTAGSSFTGQTKRTVTKASSFIGQSLRKVIAGAGFTGQTKRTVLNLAGFTGQGYRIVKSAASFTGQTLRGVHSLAGFVGQGYRKVTSSSAFIGQTKRTVLNLAGFTGQGYRIVKSAASFTGQSYRVVKEAASFEAQTLRIIISHFTAYFEAQTVRIVKSAASFTGQTKRIVTVGALFTGQTVRTVKSLASFSGQTLRTVKSLASFTGQTSRTVKSLASFSGQGLRRVSNLASFTGQALRRVTAFASFTGQAYRKVTALAEFVGQTLRVVQRFAAAEFVGQCLRRVTRAASFEAQTRRKITWLASATAQTSRTVKSLAEYSAQTVRRLKNIASFTGQTRRNIITTVYSNMVRKTGQMVLKGGTMVLKSSLYQMRRKR